MNSHKEKIMTGSQELERCPTGLRGLDEILHGGLPKGRPALIGGSAGCGKTVLGVEFLVKGALDYNEPGLFVSFEERCEDLVNNFSGMGFDLDELQRKQKLKISHISLSREDIIQTGVFTLEGLLIRLKAGVEAIGAKRLTLDSLDSILSMSNDKGIIRRELIRVFDWIKSEGITCIITCESDKDGQTRHGFEDFVSDCFIMLDHRIYEHISKRRLRVVKCRGASHGKDEYPFMIGADGFAVLPISSTTLDYDVTDERVSTGIPSLDAAFGGEGYFKGSTVMVTGKAGTGKSSIAATFAAAACERGERVLYLAYEESAGQLMRNMSSIGVNLQNGSKDETLKIISERPSGQGLEEHLVIIMNTVRKFKPSCVVIDPITGFLSVGGESDIKSMLTRVLDHMKKQGITLIMTALTPGGGQADATDTDVSSLVDTWIALEQERAGNKHCRNLYVIKSRGMDHSHETHNLVMSADGLSVHGLPEEQKDKQ